MGLSSAWKEVKGVVKKVADMSAKTAGYSKWSGLRDAANDPLSYLSFGTWAGVKNIDQIIPQTMGMFSGDMFQQDFDFPEQTTPAETIYPQQADSTGEGSLNRRRRASPYATTGGALGDRTFATSGIRTTLG